MSLPLSGGIAMPADVGTAIVTGRFGVWVDGDTFIAATELTVIIAPEVPYIVDAASVPDDAVTVLLDPLECTVDDQGYLCGPNMLRTVTLIAPADLDINPRSWSYHAVFVRRDGSARPASFSFTVVEGTTTDISTLVPVAASTGTGLSAAEAARDAAIAAAALAASYLAAFLAGIDGGSATSTFSGTFTIDGGSAAA